MITVAIILSISQLKDIILVNYIQTQNHRLYGLIFQSIFNGQGTPYLSLSVYICSMLIWTIGLTLMLFVISDTD